MNMKSKVVRIGSGKYGNVFCKIEIVAEDSFVRLSISGVEGPTRDGNARGSCGQIVDHINVKDFAPGWDQELLTKFCAVWNRWHLNDMRAGCEHQRAEDWGNEQVEVVSYKLTSEAYQMRKVAQAKASAAAISNQVAELSETEKALLFDDWFKDIYMTPDADSPLSGCYEVSKRETQRANWVYENQHPRGVLCKPCPTCGYKYGSKWLKEDLPKDVIEFLGKLPETDKTPAWV